MQHILVTGGAGRLGRLMDVGSQHMLPPTQGEDLGAVYQLIQQWCAKESQPCLS